MKSTTSLLEIEPLSFGSATQQVGCCDGLGSPRQVCRTAESFRSTSPSRSRSHGMARPATVTSTESLSESPVESLTDHLAGLERLIARLEERIDELMTPFAEQIKRLDQVPGIDVRSAQAVIAETGGDMRAFPSAAHLSSWAGMCPGHHKSASKRKKGTASPGNRWLRATPTRCVWAASHAKNSCLSAQYRRLAGRRGRKRALVAVGCSIPTIAYERKIQDREYQDLGSDWFDRQQPQRVQRHLVRRLEAWGTGLHWRLQRRRHDVFQNRVR